MQQLLLKTMPNIKEEKLLEGIATVNNAKIILRLLKKNAITDNDVIDIAEINSRARNDENNTYYNYQFEETNGDTAKIRLIDTGYKDADDNILWIGLVRQEDNSWGNARFGTEDNILNVIKNLIPAAEVENSEEKKNTEANKKILKKKRESEMTSEANDDIPDNTEDTNEIELESENEPETEVKEEVETNIEDEKTEDDSSIEMNENDTLDAEADDTSESEDIEYSDDTEENTVDDENIEIADEDIQVENLDIPSENGHINNNISVNADINTSILAMSKCWISTSHSDEAFKYYLGTLCNFAFLHKDEQDLLSNDNGGYAINTGILDKFGHDVLLYFHVTTGKGGAYIDSYSNISSKFELRDYGFSDENIKRELSPIKIWNTEDEIKRIHHAKFEDFDVYDRDMLTTLLEQKEEEFKNRNLTVTPYGLSKRIEDAISISLRINQRDNGYIKAGYDSTTDSIHFLIPLRIVASANEEAELILEVYYEKGFYRLYDIIDPYEAYLKAKIVSPYLAITSI